MDNQQIVKIVGLTSSLFSLPFLYIIKYYFYKRFLGFKYSTWKFLLCSLFITLINFFVMEIVSEPLAIIIYNMIWLIIIYFLCNGNFLIKLYSVIVEDIILLLINIGFITFDFKVLPLTQHLNLSFTQHMIVSFFNVVFNDFIRLGILFIFLRNICNLLDLKQKSINLYQSLYLLIPCLSIYSLTIVFYIIHSTRFNNKDYYMSHIFPNIYYVLPLVSFALLISILITAYTFNKMLEGEQEHNRRMLMEKQFNLQLKHSKNIEGLYSGIRSIKHDMNNHLSCLKNLADLNNIEELKNYLNTISQTISKIDFQIKTGNPISDAIINEKYNISKVEGIEFVCDFMLPNKILIDPVDLCVILSNSLDNSIEACMRISDCNVHKKICIKSYLKKMYLIIEISNSTTDKLQYVDKKLITSKPDANNHGIGISNIEATIKKYNGVFDIVEEKNKFILNMMFKLS